MVWFIVSRSIYFPWHFPSFTSSVPYYTIDPSLSSSVHGSRGSTEGGKTGVEEDTPKRFRGPKWVTGTEKSAKENPLDLVSKWISKLFGKDPRMLHGSWDDPRLQNSCLFYLCVVTCEPHTQHDVTSYDCPYTSPYPHTPSPFLSPPSTECRVYNRGSS